MAAAVAAMEAQAEAEEDTAEEAAEDTSSSRRSVSRDTERHTASHRRLQPEPYEFAYGSDDGYGVTQERQESQDASGNVRGSYSFKDDKGLMRRVTICCTSLPSHRFSSLVIRSITRPAPRDSRPSSPPTNPDWALRTRLTCR